MRLFGHLVYNNPQLHFVFSRTLRISSKLIFIYLIRLKHFSIMFHTLHYLPNHQKFNTEKTYGCVSVSVQCNIALLVLIIKNLS